jgi:DNA-binding NarL/FixJ family response regulator
LGFLPGDLSQKVDPYLRPLYDALYDLMGHDKVLKAFERNAIEVAPLAFMRGRTLNNAFVILDEAQNTSTEQMKMFLTRIGFGAKAVVTGDVSQIDLPKGQLSGLIDAERVLKRVKGIAFTRFSSADVVRHPLVARIVDAYDAQGSAVMRAGVEGIVYKDGAEGGLVDVLEKVHAGSKAIDSALLQRALDLSLSADAGGPLERLNQRERRIARLVARGMRNRDIGTELGIGEGTVKVYLHAMYQKLGIENRTELALLAVNDPGE